ncbi:hypothetical protein P389DRAFT_83410 [Cystobasidium minutum MCA 4210]|uniref:uncharacterized protein n=1 Tax=Cystobasidium minutum MCA 4210 TaxID=1397322 RepID=UPI0034CFD37F|eukprot:jgi/Rhomi1/83410/CE83409_40
MESAVEEKQRRDRCICTSITPTKRFNKPRYLLTLIPSCTLEMDVSRATFIPEEYRMASSQRASRCTCTFRTTSFTSPDRLSERPHICSCPWRSTHPKLNPIQQRKMQGRRDQIAAKRIPPTCMGLKLNNMLCTLSGIYAIVAFVFVPAWTVVTV